MAASRLGPSTFAGKTVFLESTDFACRMGRNARCPNRACRSFPKCADMAATICGIWMDSHDSHSVPTRVRHFRQAHVAFESDEAIRRKRPFAASICLPFRLPPATAPCNFRIGADARPEHAEDPHLPLRRDSAALDSRTFRRWVPHRTSMRSIAASMRKLFPPNEGRHRSKAPEITADRGFP